MKCPFLGCRTPAFRSALQKFVWRLALQRKQVKPFGLPSGQAAWTRWCRKTPRRRCGHSDIQLTSAVVRLNRSVGLWVIASAGGLRRPSCRRPLLCLRGIPAPGRPAIQGVAPRPHRGRPEANRRRGYRRLATCHSPGCFGPGQSSALSSEMWTAMSLQHLADVLVRDAVEDVLGLAFAAHPRRAPRSSRR